MYVRAKIIEGISQKALCWRLQRGVSRDEKSRPTAHMVVDAKGIARLRLLKISRTVGEDWLVTDGLKAGDMFDRRRVVERAGRHGRSSPCPCEVHPPKQGLPLSNNRRAPSSAFFIERPVFAWVIAIVIMMAERYLVDPDLADSRNTPPSRRLL